MKECVFITPADAHYGFLLTGVRQRMTQAEDLLETLHDIVQDDSVGLVVIDERLQREVDQEYIQTIEKNWPGVMIMLPAPEIITDEKEDYALRLIRRAIGYHVRLRI